MRFSPGSVSLIRFPQSDLENGKLRPVVVLAQLPGPFDDLLICAVTSQLRHHIDGWDDMVKSDDADFSTTGLKETSLIRIGKLATVESGMIVGNLGRISDERLSGILNRLVSRLQGNDI